MIGESDDILDDEETYENAIQAMTEINLMRVRPRANSLEHDHEQIPFRIDRRLGNEIVRSLAIESDMQRHENQSHIRTTVEDVINERRNSIDEKTNRDNMLVAERNPSSRGRITQNNGRKRCRTRSALEWEDCSQTKFRNSRNTVKTREQEVENAIIKAVRGGVESSSEKLNETEARLAVQLLRRSNKLDLILQQISPQLVSEINSLKLQIKELKLVVVEQKKTIKRKSPGGTEYEKRLKSHRRRLNMLETKQSEVARLLQLKHKEKENRLKATINKMKSAHKDAIEKLKLQILEHGIGRKPCKVQNCMKYSRGRAGVCHSHSKTLNSS